METIFNAVILLDVGSAVLMSINEEGEKSLPTFKIECTEDVVNEIIERLEEKTGIILLNPQNCGVVIKEIGEGEKEIYLLYKSVHSLGAISKAQRDILWVKKKRLEGKELPNDLEIYMSIFNGNYIECYMSYLDDFIPHYVEKSNICQINKYQVPECVSVIRESFMSVAREFELTEENASHFTAFATTEYYLNWQLEHENRRMIAYYEDMRIVGYYSLLIMKKGECELNNLCVLPEYRGKGIGAKLLMHSFEIAREEGCKIMNIGIINENATLKRWFLTNGFEQIRVEKPEFFPLYCAYMKRNLE